MAAIDRYIFRTVFGAFLLILVNLTLVIWVTQILRQINLITNQGQTVLDFLRITSLLLPILMQVIAPIALSMAICYALLKLNGDSELVVMNAAGISPRRLFRPIFLACVIVAVFVFYIGADLAPRLHRKMAEEFAKVRTDVVANIVRPGAFVPVDRGLVFNIRERIGENQFRGIFIDDSRNPAERATVVAEFGRIVQRPDGAFLVMRDGNVQRRKPKERDPTIVLFDQYAFDLNHLAPEPQLVIGLREKFLWDLIFPSPDDPVLKNSPGQFRVEMHDRLYAPLYPLAFGMVAFSVLGFPRTTRQSRALAITAVTAMLSILRIGGFAGTATAFTHPAALIVLYAMIAAAMAFGAVVVWRGVPLDFGNKIDMRAVTRRGLDSLERIAARFSIRLPAAELLRRFEGPE